MDEPSIPMDQEEEDNDEYFSARETQKKGSKENLSKETLVSSTPSPVKSEEKQQMFFSDEAAQQGSEGLTKKSEKEKGRRLKDRNRWDMREYKKEELELQAKPKKKKKKKTKSKEKKESKKEAEEKREASKTDEESEEKEETKEPVGTSPQASDRVEPEPRPFFQSEELILKCKQEKPIAPRCKFVKLRFDKTQEVVEYDTEGAQPLQPACNERAISNPWRRWGSHRALCDQGGFMVGKNKKLIEIKRGSDPPRCPPNPRQVMLNKNCEAPDSQTMMGTIKVEVGPAEDEVHRIGRVMEEYVKNGGFVPPPMTKNEMAAQKPKGTPVVVVQTKGKKRSVGSRLLHNPLQKGSNTPK
ncbi:hypothetical protein PMAYCL1PPCAC_14212 [Pristionchus mayeri]|uniref:Uncharacterized protein n=1 Tax=Pristionchus mayeri TaxID=1317129 RepID=A0AAN4ZMF2_9BILA|nr:hypothetical protein PMAYCL1PPCAC_14212 [Pristionchus mayeri]